ncbi:MAG: hypothetical protein U0237_08695 [Thermoleophilia bacterium]
MRERWRGRLGLAVAFAAGLAVAGAATAGAAGLLTGRDIQDGSIQARDLSPAVNAKLAKAGKRGLRGPQGPQGPAGAFTTTLAAGQTIRGVINEDSVAAGADEIRGGSISFGVSLNTAPTVVVRPPSASPTPQCPGSAGDPRAASGTLCIYLVSLSNIRQVPPSNRQLFVFNVPDQNDGANTFGAEYFIHSNTAGRFFVDGTWAVTGN